MRFTIPSAILFLKGKSLKTVLSEVLKHPPSFLPHVYNMLECNFFTRKMYKINLTISTL